MKYIPQTDSEKQLEKFISENNVDINKADRARKRLRSINIERGIIKPSEDRLKPGQWEAIEYSTGWKPNKEEK